MGCPKSTYTKTVCYLNWCNACDAYNQCTSGARLETENEGIDTLNMNKPTVYPNPTVNNFKLLLPKTESVYSIKLYNAKGIEILKKERLLGSSQFEFGKELEIGIYLLYLNDGSKTQTIKIIKN